MSEFEKNFRETIDLSADSGSSGRNTGRNLQRLSPGDKLSDSYILRVRLGRGGMGEIWKADELSNGKFLRHVVIKVVAPDIQNAELEMKRIEDMFQKIHSLQHQHICPMYAMKEDPVYGHFIVMKFIDGITLQAYHDNYVTQHGNFPLSELTRLLAPIADALDYSHSKKILHRDVKPQNIMVSRDKSDGVQLIDFGLVADLHTSMTRSTMTQISTSGTLPYMSPEQWSGEYQDAQTDQFSLAVVAYELLSGRLPFVASDVQVLGFQILNKTPAPVEGVPDYTNAALLKGLAKNRKERFDSCAAFVRALEHPEEMPDKLAGIWKYRVEVGLVAVLAMLALIVAILLPFLLSEDTRHVAGYAESGPWQDIPPRRHPSGPPMVRKETAAENVPVESGNTGTAGIASAGAAEPVHAETHAAQQGNGAAGLSGKTSEHTPDTAAGNEAAAVRGHASADDDIHMNLAGQKMPVSPPAPVEGAQTPAGSEETPEAVSENPVPQEPGVSPEVKPEVKLGVKPPAAVETRTPDALFAEANQLSETKNWEAAIPLYTKYLATENPQPKAYILRAIAYENTQNFQLAYEDFQKYTRVEPDYEAVVETLLDCANMCEEYRDFPRAVQICDQLLQRMEKQNDPRAEEVRRMEVIYLVCGACETMTREKYQVASTALKKLLEKSPEDSELLAEQARLRFTTRWEEKACDLALAQLNAIIQRDPKCVKALLYLGIMKRDIYNSKSEAIRDFLAALANISPGLPAEEEEHLKQQSYFQMALAWAALGEKEFALRDFDMALELTPNDPFVHYARGRFYQENASLEEAAADFRTAVRISPDYFIAESALGETFLQKALATEDEKQRRNYFQTAGKMLMDLVKKDKDLKNHTAYYEQLMEVYKAYNNRGEIERCKKRIQELKAMGM